MAIETTQAAGRRRTALADAAFDRLRADLLRGGPLTARRRLVTEDLAVHLDMSRTPVRDALDRLEQLGYLETVEGGGYERRRYRRRDIRDLYELRRLLEPLAAELAATARALPGRTSGEAEFHARIAEASGNRVLAKVIGLVSERVAALSVDARSAARPGARAGHYPADAPSHERIRKAVRSGDASSARSAMDRHVADELSQVLRRRAVDLDEMSVEPD
jgi:DNA-binding GntR family transcriptional regulator